MATLNAVLQQGGSIIIDIGENTQAAASSAAQAAESAAASAASAGASAASATQSAGFANNAQSYAQTVLMLNPYYATVAAGMAAVAVGGVFTTAESGQLVAYLKTGASSNTILPLGSREKLTGNRTYYVRTDGNDGNNGLVANSAGAFLSLQRAINAAYALDCNGFSVTIQINNGTRTGQAITLFGRLTGSPSPLSIIGNEASPGSVILESGGSDTFGMGNKATALLAGVTLRNIGGGDLINMRDHARLDIRNVHLADCAREMIVTTTGSYCRAVGPVTVVGNAFGFCHPQSKSVIDFSDQTLTYSGTRDFTNYLYGINDATMRLDSATIVGRANTGLPFVHINGVLNVSSCTGIWTGSVKPLAMTGGVICAESQMESRTLYVSTAGSDANDGFASVASRALRTIQEAVNRIATYANREVVDANDQGWTISLSADTFSEDVVMRKLPTRNLAIIGAGSGAAPRTDIRSITNQVPDLTVTVQNALLVGAMSGQSAVFADGALIRVSGVRFDTANFAHMIAQNGGRIEVVGNCTISAEFGTPPLYHMYATSGGIIQNRQRSHTVTGTVAFGSAFAYVDRLGVMRVDSSTWTGGTITGKRYDIRTNGVIDTNAASATHLPGSIAGTVATGGQYA